MSHDMVRCAQAGCYDYEFGPGAMYCWVHLEREQRDRWSEQFRVLQSEVDDTREDAE